MSKTLAIYLNNFSTDFAQRDSVYIPQFGQVIYQIANRSMSENCGLPI